MKRFQIKSFFAVIALFIIPGVCHAEYDYIDINNPFLRKIPIAIPIFSNLTDSSVNKSDLKKIIVPTELVVRKSVKNLM